MSCAIAVLNRPPCMPAMIWRHCAPLHVHGRWREESDDPDQRTHRTVPRPAGGLRDRPVGLCGSSIAEVCRLHGGPGGPST